MSQVLVQEREIGSIALKAIEESLLLQEEGLRIGKRLVWVDGGRESLGMIEEGSLRHIFVCLI